MTATVTNLQPYLTQREHEDRLEQAEIAAGWFFNEATKRAKAEYDATLQVALGMRGRQWQEARNVAVAKYRADTAEARKLFDESVEQFLATGELGDDLDAKWTELFKLQAVADSMQEAAE